MTDMIALLVVVHLIGIWFGYELHPMLNRKRMEREQRERSQGIGRIMAEGFKKAVKNESINKKESENDG